MPKPFARNFYTRRTTIHIQILQKFNNKHPFTINMLIKYIYVDIYFPPQTLQAHFAVSFLLFLQRNSAALPLHPVDPKYAQNDNSGISGASRMEGKSDQRSHCPSSQVGNLAIEELYEALTLEARTWADDGGAHGRLG